jgi:hypothetical protein
MGDALGRRCDLYGEEPPGAPSGVFHPDREFGDLPTGELLVMAAETHESVLRRGRALMELGLRASGDLALLQEVAAMVRDPGNRHLVTVGAVSVSQLGTAGLLVGGGDLAVALAWELAAEWPVGERSDFAWLVSSARAARSAES